MGFAYSERYAVSDDVLDLADLDEDQLRVRTVPFHWALAYQFRGYDPDGKPMFLHRLSGDYPDLMTVITPQWMYVPEVEDIVPQARETIRKEIEGWKERDLFYFLNQRADINRERPRLLRLGEWTVWGRYSYQCGRDTCGLHPMCPHSDEHRAKAHFFSDSEFRLLQLAQKNAELTKELAAQQRTIDGAYSERNYLVALLARLFPSGTRPTVIEGWDPDWQNCVYIDLPSGQISYHYHSREAALFADLPFYEKPWDGHVKADVHRRLLAAVDKDAPEAIAETLTAYLLQEPHAYRDTTLPNPGDTEET